jgi:hypothetical protein
MSRMRHVRGISPITSGAFISEKKRIGQKTERKSAEGRGAAFEAHGPGHGMGRWVGRGVAGQALFRSTRDPGNMERRRWGREGVRERG